MTMVAPMSAPGTGVAAEASRSEASRSEPGDTPAPMPAPPRRPGPRNRTALRLWRRLLSAGSGEVAELRGWERVINWHNPQLPPYQRYSVRRFVKLPARAAREAVADVRRFGDEVTAEGGVSRARQLWQLWWLKVRHGLGPQAYLDFRLYRPDRWRRAGEYVALPEFARVMRHLIAHAPDTDAWMLRDKRRFDAWCREHDFPTVSTLVEWQDGEVVDSSLAGGVLPQRDLFSKPADSTGGYGTSRWLYDGRGGYVGADGRARRPDELYAELAQLSQTLPRRYGRMSRRILLQRHLYNHPSLAPFTRGALSTVRIVTYRFPDAAPQLLFGACRMPIGDAPADNFHYGGVVAPVDPTGALLGPAIRRRGAVIVDVERHPDTGAEIAGFRLPFWDEAVALVLRAHGTLRRVTVVGWDVALTEDGPLLVEGNMISDPDIAQAPTGVPLGATPLVRCLNAHLRACFGL
jgi:hypothetical protein